MATKFASASGNWSTMVWWTTSGGSTTTTAPGVGDDADLNGKTVTIDQNVTCDAIVGATGTLAVSGNRTINAQLGRAGSEFTCTINTPSQTVNLNGNVVAGAIANRFSVTNAGTTLVMVGNTTGGSSTNVLGVNQTAGTINFTGITTGGTAGGTSGLRAGGGTCIVNAGSSIVGGVGQGLLVAGSTATVAANAIAGTAAAINQTSGTLNFTGSLIESSTALAITHTGGTLNYTPGPTDTVTIGGKTLYPTTGAIIARIVRQVSKQVTIQRNRQGVVTTQRIVPVKAATRITPQKTTIFRNRPTPIPGPIQVQQVPLAQYRRLFSKTVQRVHNESPVFVTVQNVIVSSPRIVR